jgi:hypothetical protein
MEKTPIKKRLGNKIYEKVVSTNGEKNIFFPQSSQKVDRPTKKSFINQPLKFPQPTESQMKDFTFKKAIKRASVRARLEYWNERIVALNSTTIQILSNFLSVLESVQLYDDFEPISYNPKQLVNEIQR